MTPNDFTRKTIGFTQCYSRYAIVYALNTLFRGYNCIRGRSRELLINYTLSLLRSKRQTQMCRWKSLNNTNLLQPTQMTVIYSDNNSINIHIQLKTQT